MALVILVVFRDGDNQSISTPQQDGGHGDGSHANAATLCLSLPKLKPAALRIPPIPMESNSPHWERSQAHTSTP